MSATVFVRKPGRPIAGEWRAPGEALPVTLFGREQLERLIDAGIVVREIDGELEKRIEAHKRARAVRRTTPQKAKPSTPASPAPTVLVNVKNNSRIDGAARRVYAANEPLDAEDIAEFKRRGKLAALLAAGAIEARRVEKGGA